MWSKFKPELNSVIFSLNPESKFIQQLFVTNMVSTCSSEFTVARLSGCYKGENELSFQVDMKAVDWSQLRPALRETNQDCVLHVRNGKVYNGVKDYDYQVDRFTKSMGVFTEVPRGVAVLQKYYTYCAITNKYYVVKDYA